MINRRNFISTTTTLAAGAGLSSLVSQGLGKLALTTEAFAADTPAAHHHHSQNLSGPMAQLAKASSNCVEKGEACLQHCIEMLTSGDQSMVSCTRSVREMQIYCEALSKAAARNSKYVKQLAKIAMDACKECEDACRKHADKHDVCKQCADACAECYKACKAVQA